MGDDCELLGMRTDLEVKDRVYLVPDPDARGTVVEVEENRLSVMVVWDDSPSGTPDFQWANKVARLEANG
jgi:hypothetical protein